MDQNGLMVSVRTILRREVSLFLSENVQLNNILSDGTANIKLVSSVLIIMFTIQKVNEVY